MKTINIVLMGAAVAASFLLSDIRPVRACDSTQPLTYYGGYVDAYDSLPNVILVFWGYGTYGDPLSFENAANAELDAHSVGPSLGITGTRFYGVPSQYSGTDWNALTFEQIAPARGSFYVTDEGGLPPPDPVTGQITLSDTDIMNEADYIAYYYSSNYDDIVVVFPPPNAPPPVPGCGQHFLSSQYTVSAWVTYPGQGSCTYDFQQQALAHEITEAVEDPAWNYGVSAEGWDQGTDATCETGDVCEGLEFSVQTEPASNNPSVVQIQPEMSNEAIAAGQDGCVYGRSTTAYLVGLFTKTSTYLVSTTVSANTSLTFSNAPNWGAPTGVTLTGAPAAASWGLGHIDAFVRGTNGKMYHATTDDEGVTVTWEQLSSAANFTQSPDAVSWGPGNVEVFGVQGTNIVKNTKNYGASWSGWTTVNKPSGVNPSSKVSVASWGATSTTGFPISVRTILAAFRGSDGKVWIGNSADGGSFSWTGVPAPATLTGDPDISTSAPPRFDLFVLDNRGNFWDMYSTNGFSLDGSVNLGHPAAGGFQVGAGAAGMGDGRLLIGGRVGTNSAYVQFRNWAAGNWVSTFVPYITGIDIASP